MLLDGLRGGYGIAGEERLRPSPSADPGANSEGPCPTFVAIARLRPPFGIGTKATNTSAAIQYRDGAGAADRRGTRRESAPRFSTATVRERPGRAVHLGDRE